MQQEPSIIREQLVNDFTPDDACPLGAQLSAETTGNVYQSGLKDDKLPEMVTCIALHFFFLIISIYVNLHCSRTWKYAG